MIGDYGKLPAAKLQQFTAQAILRPKSAERVSGVGMVDTVTVHTDGVILTCEEDPTERRAGFVPAFRLVAGKTYRVTVEEL